MNNKTAVFALAVSLLAPAVLRADDAGSNVGKTGMGTDASAASTAPAPTKAHKHHKHHKSSSSTTSTPAAAPATKPAG